MPPPPVVVVIQKGPVGIGLVTVSIALQQPPYIMTLSDIFFRFFLNHHKLTINIGFHAKNHKATLKNEKLVTISKWLVI